MTERIFVYADWSQLESWLTAIFAQDECMLGELNEQLAGGPKLHAKNAALLFGASHGVTVDNAKEVKVILQGREKTAYDGGKRISHLKNYGGGAKMIADTFWLTLKFATQCSRALDEKYARTAAWRDELADEVYGVALYVCSRCGYAREREGGRCPACFRWPIELRWKGWKLRPANELRTVFDRRRLYLGRRADGADAAAAQRPQSSGISMWYRTLQRLSGFDTRNGERVSWPVPECWYRVTTGTYDSFLLETVKGQEENVLRWLMWTMEQPWPQLASRRFPCEGKIGWNWGEVSEDNPSGLCEVKTAPLKTTWEA